MHLSDAVTKSNNQLDNEVTVPLFYHGWVLLQPGGLLPATLQRGKTEA